MKIERPSSPQKTPDTLEKVFTGKIFDVYQWQQEMFDGSFQTFEKVKRPDTVVIFPILDNGNILLLEQEQPGKPSFIGGAGGRMNEGEDVLEAAKREFLEETGYEASDYILWKAEHPQTKIDWVVYFFIAKGCKKIVDQSLDSGEKVCLKPVSFDTFISLARDKKFREVEIVPDLYEALLDKTKYDELKKLFSPLT